MKRGVMCAFLGILEVARLVSVCVTFFCFVFIPNPFGNSF